MTSLQINLNFREFLLIRGILGGFHVWLFPLQLLLMVLELFMWSYHWKRSLVFLGFIVNDGGQMFVVLSKSSVYLFCFFFFVVGKLQCSARGIGSLTGDASVRLFFFFGDSWLSGVLVTDDLVSDDLTSVYLETEFLNVVAA